MYRNIMQDRFNPGTDLTAVATTDVTGKTFCAYSGAMKSGNIAITTATAGEAVAGVIKYDAAGDSLVGVARGSGRVVTVTAATALAAGTAVEVGTDGKATTADTGIIVGWAVDDAEADADALISLAH